MMRLDEAKLGAQYVDRAPARERVFVFLPFRKSLFRNQLLILILTLRVPFERSSLNCLRLSTVLFLSGRLVPLFSAVVRWLDKRVGEARGSVQCTLTGPKVHH